jgi:hypothetical protein
MNDDVIRAHAIVPHHLMRCLSHDLIVPRRWAEYHSVEPNYRRESHACSDWVGELAKSAQRVVHFVFKAAPGTSQIPLFDNKIESDRIDRARYHSDS